MPIPNPARRGLRAIAVLAATTIAPLPVAGQGQSVLLLLDVDGRQLEMNSEARGALSSSDYLSTRDNYLEAWSLDGVAGQSVTIDLVSEEFDTFLYVVGPGLGETLTDDDSGGGCNSRLTFTFLETGSFRVVASSLSERETGTYTVSVSDTPGPTPGYACGDPNPEVIFGMPTDDRTLQLGDVKTGRLAPGAPVVEDGRTGQAWVLEGTAGTSVTVTLEADDFDAYLFIAGPGLEAVLSDDDGAGDRNAQITIDFPEDGAYRVIASSFGDGATGAYTIRVEEPLDLNTLPTEGRSIGVGDTETGMLTSTDPVVVDGRRGQVWALEASAGESATIELLSDDFDCYLYLVGPGLDEPLSDDDGAGDLNSRLTVTFPESGIYRIIVSALGAEGTGAFTLQVR